jgi:hypothetical protein
MNYCFYENITTHFGFLVINSPFENTFQRKEKVKKMKDNKDCFNVAFEFFEKIRYLISINLTLKI